MIFLETPEVGEDEGRWWEGWMEGEWLQKDLISLRPPVYFGKIREARPLRGGGGGDKGLVTKKKNLFLSFNGWGLRKELFLRLTIDD